MKNWEIVTKDELDDFIKSYPCELDTDYREDIWRWFDEKYPGGVIKLFEKEENKET